MPACSRWSVTRSGNGPEANVRLEGWGPGGVALLVEARSDDPVRAEGSLHEIVSAFGGSVGVNGCTAWMFSPCGVLLVPKTKATREQLDRACGDAGLEIVNDAGDSWELLTAPGAREAVQKTLADSGIPVTSSRTARVPQTLVPLSGADADRMVRLHAAIAARDDVLMLCANFDAPGATGSRKP
jgi:transcriptional/translational regulatory protein YebC/TACO1